MVARKYQDSLIAAKKGGPNWKSEVLFLNMFDIISKYVIKVWSKKNVCFTNLFFNVFPQLLIYSNIGLGLGIDKGCKIFKKDWQIARNIQQICIYLWYFQVRDYEIVFGIWGYDKTKNIFNMTFPEILVLKLYIKSKFQELSK